MLHDTPGPPAAAFYEMQVFLPQTYFLTPPPAEGVLLTVTGHDRVGTTWRLSEELAAAVEQQLGHRPVKVKRKRYDDRNKREAT